MSKDPEFGFDPRIAEVIEAESISLFDVEPGTKLELDLSFDDDGRTTGRLVLSIDRPGRREDWDRGSFTVLEAELPVESPTGEWVGRTGSIDSAVTYRKGLMPPITLAQIAHITKGRHLIVNFDIPTKPDMVNRLIPFVVDCRSTAPEEVQTE